MSSFGLIFSKPNPPALARIPAEVAVLGAFLQRKNPNFGNRAWGNIPEAILGFEPQNESQGWLQSWNNGQLVVPNPNWVCDHATKMRHSIPNKNIFILSGGGTDYDSCKLINFFQCPAVYVVSIHTYADANLNVLSQFVGLTKQYNKRVIVEEFGYTGNKANFMLAAQNAGLPWMIWEVLKPGNTCGYETWTDESEAWQAIVNGASTANSKAGQWPWPEMAGHAKYGPGNEPTSTSPKLRVWRVPTSLSICVFLVDLHSRQHDVAGV
ncbi:unnamed protein product [Aphanomyces euteiches]